MPEEGSEPLALEERVIGVEPRSQCSKLWNRSSTSAEVVVTLCQFRKERLKQAKGS